MTDVQLAVFRSLVEDVIANGVHGPSREACNLHLAVIAPAALAEIDQLRKELQEFLDEEQLQSAPKLQGIIDASTDFVGEL